MTFFATLLFGAGALLLISAIENPPGGITATITQILAGDITVTPAPSSASSSTTQGGSANVTGPTSPAGPVVTQ